jgi:hypothetical protein
MVVPPYDPSQLHLIPDALYRFKVIFLRRPVTTRTNSTVEEARIALGSITSDLNGTVASTPRSQQGRYQEPSPLRLRKVHRAWTSPDF